MNKRIRELAKQAGFDCPPDGNVYHPDIGDGVMLDGYLEKFAELIVSECISVGKSVQLDTGQEEYALEQLLEIIRNHFGIEEENT